MGTRNASLMGMAIATGVVLLLVVVSGNFYTNPYVPAGHEGYVFERPRVWGEGGFRGEVTGPGNYGISFWRNYPAVVASAVERKLAAQQLLEQKETQKAIARKDAEIRIEEAKGIAEAQRIINATLTEYYLQHEAINAQITMAGSPNHTTVYIPVGSNGIPVIRTANDR